MIRSFDSDADQIQRVNRSIGRGGNMGLEWSVHCQCPVRLVHIPCLAVHQRNQSVVDSPITTVDSAANSAALFLNIGHRCLVRYSLQPALRVVQGRSHRRDAILIRSHVLQQRLFHFLLTVDVTLVDRNRPAQFAANSHHVVDRNPPAQFVTNIVDHFDHFGSGRFENTRDVVGLGNARRPWRAVQQRQLGRHHEFETNQKPKQHRRARFFFSHAQLERRRLFVLVPQGDVELAPLFRLLFHVAITLTTASAQCRRCLGSTLPRQAAAGSAASAAVPYANCLPTMTWHFFLSPYADEMNKSSPFLTLTASLLFFTISPIIKLLMLLLLLLFNFPICRHKSNYTIVEMFLLPDGTCSGLQEKTKKA
ncbi:hypothetical protein T01_14235 [Trichinella spiralis]|uniref:Uncharacterized protein n=1 Tax=Trichinella spiralis TaxID=6334 RepID=A0A0V1BLZ2_TRISP|nr:hypothetical protein T01_14235 [Trichinella spiralis]